MTVQRLSKLMASRGICSRREADTYIEAGQVLVNGEVISVLGTKVPEDVEIQLLSKAQNAQAKKVTILLHKPVGVASMPTGKGYPLATELITSENLVGPGKLLPEHKEKLGIAGRLDIDSSGLLILSQDGTVIREIIGPESDMEKEYLVRVEGDVTKDCLRRLRFGLTLDDQPLKKALVEKLEDGLYRFVLKEGKKRQIRRMCESVGLLVTQLKRVRIGKILLGNLPRGKWKFLDT